MRTIRERCLVFQQNPLTATCPSLSSHKFLLFSSRISPSLSLVLLNQTKTRQEGRDSRLFRGLDNSQPPCKKRSAKRSEEEQQGRRERRSGKNANNERGRYPGGRSVGRSVALASCARCKDKSPGETSTRWESNSVSLWSRRRIQVALPVFIADATLNPPSSVIEFGFYTTLRRSTR